MIRNVSARLALIATAVVVCTGLTTTDADAQLSGKIAVDGSSTVYPITEAVAEEFAKEYKNVRVTVAVSGTGGGFKRFAIGETDISDASRPIKGSENAKAVANKIDFVEIPVAYDGLTIVVHKNNDWVKSMTVEQLRKIFLEKYEGASAAKTWKDVDSAWPDVAIKIYAPGTDSGTFDYFKEVVANKGKLGNFRPDMSVSEDDNVLVRGVAGDKGAIGFFGCAYYFENKDKIKAAPIINKAGKAIAPKAETIEDGSYNPFSRPLFIYVNKKSLDKPQVTAFVDFYFEAGPELAEEVGYVRLPSSVYAAAKYNVRFRKTGSQFLDKDGNKVSGAVTDVFKAIK